jgi:SAM-dependent methyltransferase
VNRIIGSNIHIDPKAVRDFFDQRGQKVNKEHPITSVLYQDSNPQLAETRDKYEKQKLLPLLNLTGAENVLDIGCGIGRWADAISESVNQYVGLDVSETLIEYARANHAQKNCRFEVLPAEDVSALAFSSLSIDDLFDRVICAGLTIYMNDDMLHRMIGGLCDVMKPGCLLYIREPIAREQRLTLDKFWSEELKSHYSAIYRTQSELESVLETVLAAKGKQLNMLHHGPVYTDPSLDNRGETYQFFWVAEVQQANP